QDRVVPQVRGGAVRGLPGKGQLLHPGTLRVHRPRLAVADRAADHGVALVGGDDLQLARLAAEDLGGSDLTEQLASDEVASAAKADLLPEGPQEPERPSRLP